MSVLLLATKMLWIAIKWFCFLNQKVLLPIWKFQRGFCLLLSWVIFEISFYFGPQKIDCSFSGNYVDLCLVVACRHVDTLIIVVHLIRRIVIFWNFCKESEKKNNFVKEGKKTISGRSSANIFNSQPPAEYNWSIIIGARFTENKALKWSAVLFWNIWNVCLDT